MAKKVFAVYLAKEGNPNSEAYAKLELPASPWEVWDAMDKVRLLDGEKLYLEIDEYYRFDALAPHLAGLDISLNELNDLAERLAKLDEVQGIAYRGLLEMAVQEKMESNGGIITSCGIWRSAPVGIAVMWWMLPTTHSLGASMRKTTLSPNWTAYPTRCSRCWTSPALEE